MSKTTPVAGIDRNEGGKADRSRRLKQRAVVPARERGILFTAEMVRSILDGRKTQTRRVLKSPDFTLEMCETSNPPHLRYHEFNRRDGERYQSGSGPFDPSKASDQAYATSFCPYGKVGDRLWVRETWLELVCGHEHDSTKPRRCLVTHNCRPKVNCIAYRADCTDPDSERCRIELGYKWRPSIFMPRWASRLTLELTDVRVERLQAITNEDAIAEGIEPVPGKVGEWFYPGKLRELSQQSSEPTWVYEELWKQINGAESWKANPFVWVLGFKRVESEVDNA